MNSRTPSLFAAKAVCSTRIVLAAIGLPLMLLGLMLWANMVSFSLDAFAASTITVFAYAGLSAAFMLFANWGATWRNRYLSEIISPIINLSAFAFLLGGPWLIMSTVVSLLHAPVTSGTLLLAPLCAPGGIAPMLLISPTLGVITWALVIWVHHFNEETIRNATYEIWRATSHSAPA